MAFKYRGGDRTVEDVDRRSKQSGGGYDGFLASEVSFFKPREGENAVRILPPTWDDKKKWGTGWEIQVYLHRNVGPDNGTYLCLDKMKGEKCPICEARRDADEDEADKLRAQWRALAWVIDRNSEKSGPLVWGLPITLFRDINNRSTDKKTKELLLIDGDKDGFGYDVLFTRVGSGVKTKYEGLEIDRDATPVHDNEKTETKWLDYVEDNPLPEILEYYPADHIEKVLFGKAERRKKGGEDEDEQEDTRGSRRRRAEPTEEEETPRRRGRREEPAEEEQEERPRRGRREETSEEEETPSRRRRAELVEEEAEPEEAPSRRRRAEPTEEEETSRGGRVERRRRSEPADEGGADDPSTQAKKRLGRLRERM